MALASASAQATFITFDELPWVPIDAWFDNPVTTQYASLGVTFKIGFLAQTNYTGTPPPHINQYLLGANSMQVSFSGTLPHYVNFNMSSPYGEYAESYAVAVDAQGKERPGPHGGVLPRWQPRPTRAATRPALQGKPAHLVCVSGGHFIAVFLRRLWITAQQFHRQPVLRRRSGCARARDPRSARCRSRRAGGGAKALASLGAGGSGLGRE
jgi:hypothetical protein